MRPRLGIGLRIGCFGLVALVGAVAVITGCPRPVPPKPGDCKGTCTLLGGIGSCANGTCAPPTPAAALASALDEVRKTSDKLKAILPDKVFASVNDKLVGTGGASDLLVQAQQAVARSDLDAAVKAVLAALGILDTTGGQVAGYNRCNPKTHTWNRGDVLAETITAAAGGQLQLALVRVAETAQTICAGVNGGACRNIAQQIAQVIVLPPQVLIAREGQIHGYVGAVVPLGREQCAQVNVPDIKVWAEDVVHGTKQGSATSNPQGYFQLNNIPAGDYHVCVSGNGYQNTCDPQVAIVGGTVLVLDHLVPLYPVDTAVWGTVHLADKKTSCFTYRAAFDTLVQANVKLVDAGNQTIAGPVHGNSLGQYVIPTKFTAGKLTVQAGCEAAAGGIAAIASPTPVNPYDIIVGNRAPAIAGLELFRNTAIARRADPGSMIHAVSTASDPDNDALHYKWIDESGRALALPDARSVDWALLPLGSRNVLHLQVSDGKGGYAFFRQSIVAGDNLLYFSGRVFDRGSGAAIANAKVTLGGQPVTTNASGYFSVSLPDGARFVLNVHAKGYAAASRVLRRPGTLIQVPLDQLLTAQVDMGQGGTVSFTPKGDDNKRRSFTVTFAKGSMLDASNRPFNGMATVYGWPYDLNAKNPIPGDMGAIHNGKPVVLGTWGAVDVQPTSAATGEPLQLATGKTAQVSIFIQADRQASAAPAIPLYSYDETVGTWRDAGQLTKVGVNYQGVVTHFSVFNADNQFGGSSCIKVVLDPATFPRPLALFGTYDDPNLAPFAHNGTEINANDNTPVGVLRLFPNQPFHLQVFRLGASPAPLLASVPMNSGPPLGGGVTLALDDQGNPELGVPADQSWADCNDCQGRAPGDPQYQLCNIVGPQTVPSEAIPTWLLSAGGVQDNSADYTAAVQNLGGCDRSTFTGWKTCNGFDQTPTNDDPLALPAPAAHAYYFNNGDLKFGRDMHCRIASGNRTACYVTNYGDVGSDFTGAELHDAEHGINSVATVCMEYDPNATNGENVQFWAYQGETAPHPDQPLPRPALDAQGPKPMPDMCLTCHGGSYDHQPGHKARNATFLPFDLGSFVYDDANTYNNSGSPGSATFSLNLGNPLSSGNPHQADAQEQFRRLNNLVLQMNPDALVGNSDEAIARLMTAWYGNCIGAPPCSFNGSPSVIPATPTDNTPFAGHEAIYTDVVARICRTCHVAHSGFHWTNYSEMSSGASFIQSYACATANPIVNTRNLYMPHAQVPFLRFWNDGLENALGASVPLPGGVCRSP